MEVVFYDSDNNVIQGLTQWDTNRKIVINGLGLDRAPTIQFFNAKSKKALVVIPELKSSGDVSVFVPNKLLQYGIPIIMCIYMEKSIGENITEGKTVRAFRIPVAPKPMPADYIYVEDIEYTSWVEMTHQAQALINQWTVEVDDAIRNAEEAAEEARASKGYTAETTAIDYDDTGFDITYIDPATLTEVTNDYDWLIEGNEIVGLKNITTGKTIDISGLPITGDGAEVGKFTNEDFNAEIFNDYSSNKALGVYSHAEGRSTEAIGSYSHAEGYKTSADGNGSHAEGYQSHAAVQASHAEGFFTYALASSSHTEGEYNKATGYASHVEGSESSAGGDYSHAEGRKSRAIGESSHSHGAETVAQGKESTAIGLHTLASSDQSFATGRYNITYNKAKFVKTTDTEFNPSKKYYSFDNNHYNRLIIDYNPITDEYESFPYTDIRFCYEYAGTEQDYAVVVGNGTPTKESNAFTLDWSGNLWVSGSIKDGQGHTLGDITGGVGEFDGEDNSEIFNSYEGDGKNIARRGYSHAEGWSTAALEMSAHAEGVSSVAADNNTHAQNLGTVAFGESSTAIGKYNDVGFQLTEDDFTETDKHYFIIQDGNFVFADLSDDSPIPAGTYYEPTKKYAFTVGNGGDELDDNGAYVRSNALALDWEGNLVVSGTIKDGQGHTLGEEVGSQVGQFTNQTNTSERFNDYDNNQALSEYSHAEGAQTVASGLASHAEGSGSTASGAYAHAEGNGSLATGEASHAENKGKTYAKNSHAEGTGMVSSAAEGAHAEGNATNAYGKYSHVEGNGSISPGEASHAEGKSTSPGAYSHAEGNTTVSSGANSHAEGKETQAIGESSHAEGSNTVTPGNSSHAEGYGTNATGSYSHAEGYSSKSTGYYSHAEGYSTESKNDYSHAEGKSTIASNSAAHAEGNTTTASGFASHAEGSGNEAKNDYTHAEGLNNKANAIGTHVEGMGNEANVTYSHVMGKYNANTEYRYNVVPQGSYYDSSKTYYIKENKTYILSTDIWEVAPANKYYTKDLEMVNYAFAIGNGTSDTTRSNAMWVDWQGNLNVSGKLMINGEPVEGAEIDLDTVIDSSSLYTKAASSKAVYEFVISSISGITALTISVVDVRPTVGEPNVIYFVPNEEAKPEDVYDEWVYLNNSWEHIGSTKIDLDEYAKLSDLSDVATSGDYNDLSNTPSLSTVALSGSYNDLDDTPELATVALSGSYNDLTDKPNIPVVPQLANVALTGSYNDLTNKPTIPVIEILTNEEIDSIIENA